MPISPVAALDYRDLVPFIFWPWLAWSCVTLVRRRSARRAQRAEEAMAAAQPPAVADPLLPPTRPAGDRLSPPSPRIAPPIAPPIMPPTYSAPPVAPTAFPTAPPEHSDAPVVPLDPAPSRPPEPIAGDQALISAASLSDLPPALGAVIPPGRSIFDTPAAPEPARSRKPIATLVSGIQLPCDLTPMVEFERPIGAREAVAFVTRGHDAGRVGQEVGAELRRLGFELTPRHATEVVARRDDDWLAVAVHGDADGLQRGGRLAFPGAGDTGVVVELWTE